jgi:hypothetical protein
VNTRRARIFAAQAVVVGALLLVVYLTLLKPETHQPLFGVGDHGGGGGPVAAAPSGSSGAGAGEGQRGEGQPGGGHHGTHARRDRRAGGGSRAGSASTAFSGAATPQPSELAVPTRDGAQGGVTPTEDQYGDTVSRLFGNL